MIRIYEKYGSMGSTKDMKKYTAAFFTLLAAVVVLTGCERRPLEDEFIETALIPVRIDWSVSGVNKEQMHRASVLLYPQRGGAPLEYRLEGDLIYKEINVPIGIYSVVVFNETTDPEDWDAVIFTGKNGYGTFAATGVPDAVRGFYARSETLPLIKNPEPLAAWSLDKFEVTPDMIRRTREIARSRNSRSATRALEDEVPDLTVVKPLPRYEKVTITAYVTNLSSSMQATGTLDGMASGVYMASGEKITVPAAAHAFILNGRVYESNGKDGTTTRTFNIFGRLPVSATHYEMNLDFLLNDGTLHSRETFDVTELMILQPGIVPVSTIEVGGRIYSPPTSDRPITLPDMDVSAGITVGEWNEVIIPVK